MGHATREARGRPRGEHRAVVVPAAEGPGPRLPAAGEDGDPEPDRGHQEVGQEGRQEPAGLVVEAAPPDLLVELPEVLLVEPVGVDRVVHDRGQEEGDRVPGGPDADRQLGVLAGPGRTRSEALVEQADPLEGGPGDEHVGPDEGPGLGRLGAQVAPVDRPPVVHRLAIGLGIPGAGLQADRPLGRALPAALDEGPHALQPPAVQLHVVVAEGEPAGLGAGESGVQGP